tara:strand:+ start:26 stop:400 length:375 start_codon:yes stop_codon:yes gene_type:complete
MTSQLNVDTIADKAGTGPVGLTKQQASKMFVNFNGTGTVAVRSSLNVTSITDVSTGRYRPNYTNNFDSAGDYSFHVTSGVLGATWGLQQLSTFAAGSTEFILYNSAGTSFDNSIVPCTADGDLA